MGVSGCGKSTIAKAFANAIDGTFIDADDLHPQANIDKMSQGTPLNDDDRAGWLDTIATTIQKSDATLLCIACSALKQSYRDRLRHNAENLAFIYLHGTRELLQSRLDDRKDHFMPSNLLDSQLADLEEPKNATRVEISNSPEEIVASLRQEFAL